MENNKNMYEILQAMIDKKLTASEIEEKLDNKYQQFCDACTDLIKEKNKTIINQMKQLKAKFDELQKLYNKNAQEIMDEEMPKYEKETIALSNEFEKVTEHLDSEIPFRMCNQELCNALKKTTGRDFSFSIKRGQVYDSIECNAKLIGITVKFFTIDKAPLISWTAVETYVEESIFEKMLWEYANLDWFDILVKYLMTTPRLYYGISDEEYREVGLERINISDYYDFVGINGEIPDYAQKAILETLKTKYQNEKQQKKVIRN